MSDELEKGGQSPNQEGDEPAGEAGEHCCGMSRSTESALPPDASGGGDELVEEGSGEKNRYFIRRANPGEDARQGVQMSWMVLSYQQN